MALLFTYRPGSVPAVQSAGTGSCADRGKALSSLGEVAASDSFDGGIGVAQPISEFQEAWAVPAGGLAPAACADLREFSFSCLDLLTAFEGEV